jgi:hypothetical protein
MERKEREQRTKLEAEGENNNGDNGGNEVQLSIKRKRHVQGRRCRGAGSHAGLWVVHGESRKLAVGFRCRSGTGGGRDYNSTRLGNGWKATSSQQLGGSRGWTAACMLEKGRQTTAGCKVQASGMHGRKSPAGGEDERARARVSEMNSGRGAMRRARCSQGARALARPKAVPRRTGALARRGSRTNPAGRHGDQRAEAEAEAEVARRERGLDPEEQETETEVSRGLQARRRGRLERRLARISCARR